MHNSMQHVVNANIHLHISCFEDTVDFQTECHIIIDSILEKVTVLSAERFLFYQRSYQDPLQQPPE